MPEHFISALVCLVLFRQHQHEITDHGYSGWYDHTLCVAWFVLMVWFAVLAVLS